MKSSVFISVGIGMIAVIATLFFFRHSALPPVIHELSDFSLTDQDGKPLSKSMLLGQIWIADFIFTHCGGQCPLLTHEMKRVLSHVPANIRAVSFTVDPKRDTPPVLKRYALQHQADLKRWSFVTGDQGELYELFRSGFKVVTPSPQTEPGGEEFLHTFRFVVVDSKGYVRGYFDGLESSSMDEMRRMIERLMKGDG